MERERNNTGLVVAVTVLTMLVLGLAGFIVYDKVINNNTKEPNNNEVNNNLDNNGDDVTYINYDLNAAQDLINNYVIDGAVYGYDDTTKMELAYMYLDSSDFKTMSCKSLFDGVDGWKKQEYEGFYINDDYRGCEVETKTISYDKLNQSYKNLFGSEINIPKKNFHLVTYSDKQNVFARVELYASGGDADPCFGMDKVMSAKLSSDGILTIIYGDVAFCPCRDDEKLCPTFDVDESIVYDDFYDVEENFFKKYEDQVTKWEFTFEKDNGHFVLKSLEKKQ